MMDANSAGADRQGEDTLRETVERLTAIVDAALDAIVTTDESYEILLFNAAAEKMFQCSAAEALGSSLDRFIPQPARAAHRQHVAEFGSTPIVSRPMGLLSEVCGVRTNGEEFPIEASISQVEVRGRRLFTASLRDISARNAMADLLHSERQRLASILAGTDVGTWEWNVQTGQLILNERWAEIVGYTLAELSPVSIETWQRVCHPDEMEKSDELLRRHFAGEIPCYDCECRLRHKDGHWVWVRDRGKVMTWTADGQPLEMFGTHLDITREKLAEQNLREASQFNEQIIAGAQEGIVVCGRDLRYRVWNPYMENLSGMKADDVIGRHLLELFPFLQEVGVLANVERALAGEISPLAEFPFQIPQSGRSGWASQRVGPLRNAQGEIIAAIGTIREVTAVRRAEEALRQSQQSLEARVEERTRQLAIATQTAEAANRAKSAFLANMSHEIRTPMTAIVGMIELMKFDGATARQMARLKKMNDAAQHLLNILDDVLDLSRIEAGRLTLEEATVDVEGLVASVIDMTADRAANKHLQLTADCEPLPGRLIGDPTRIRQALLNYIGNAIKFTERGSISVRARCREEDSHSILVCFEVRDTGIGVPADAIERLFSKFEQADNSMTREYGGTGLGLAIVKQIADLMGGSAGVESSEGAGSTFWFTARLKKAIARKAISTVAPGTTAGEAQERRHENRRILIVDDEVTNREVILAIVEAVGLLADCAASGHEAVELAGKTPYDLILMDLHMARMDGMEATRRIRRLPTGTRTPILALTGNVVSEIRQHCLNAGMNDFVAKPFSMDALLEVITYWLRSPAAE